MRKYLSVIILAAVLAACNKPQGELIGLGAKGNFREATPHGMVYVKRGAFMMGSNDQTAIGSINDKLVFRTVDAFWMDATEVTNDEYKQFVKWVRDSIALRALVVAGYEEYRAKDKEQLNLELAPEVALLNWKMKIPFNTQDEDLKAALNFMYYEEEHDLLKKSLNPNVLQYRYEWINTDQAALPGNKFNVNTGAYPSGAKARVDSSYIDEEGIIHNTTVTRPLRARRDLMSSRIVNIYPDTMMWVRDFQYAYNDPKMKMYFSHVGYAHYPVVGVTWEQAVAFCNWRSNYFNANHQIKAQDYRLPTEAEWEYAARGGRKGAMYPWGGPYIRDNKGCYMANFKPMRGAYTDDTGATTMKVASYLPNNYGLYDMAGNAAEWTNDAYNSSSSSLIADMNPSFSYNAKSSDGDLLKRKIVKGGSWKDIAYYLQCGSKTYEYQDQCRPYIGFRCVRSYNGE